MTYIYGLRNLSRVNESTFMRMTSIPPLMFLCQGNFQFFQHKCLSNIFQVHFCSQSEGFINKKTYTSIVLQFVSYWDCKVLSNLVLPSFLLDVINIQRYFISNFFLFFNRHIPKIGLNRHIPIFVDHNLPQRSVGYIFAPSPHDLPRPRFYH